jgi:chromosomal replication initiation ATPase DnaA
MKIKQENISTMLIPALLRYEIEPFHLVEKISMIKNIPLLDFLTKNKPVHLRDTKYMTYFLLKKHHDLTLEQIGEIFGKKHESIIRGIRKFHELKSSNTQFRNDYNQLIFNLPRLK